MVKSTEERRDFWLMLKAIAGVRPAQPAPAEDREQTIRRQVVSDIANGLMRLASGDVPTEDLFTDAGNTVSAQDVGHDQPGDADAYLAPWIDTEECTACDECTRLNSAIFAYNAAHKATIIDAEGGPYRDLVKAAEKCTAQIIHPGLPRDRSAKDIARWIERGAKYN